MKRAIQVGRQYAVLNETDGIAPLGRKLRQRRRVRGLSLQEVAGESNISLGQLSGIERGLYSPTLETLQSICAALQMSPSWLFGPASTASGESDVVVRRDVRRRLELKANGISKEMLTPDAADRIQMLRMVIRPGGGWEGPFSPPRRTITARCGLVAAGELELKLDEETHILAPGDSFGTGQRRRIAFRARGQVACEVIWITSPAVY